MTNATPLNQGTRSQRLVAGRLALRTQLWPEVSETDLWNRKRDTGFATIPRTLPIIMLIADTFAKGTPISSTYLDLWSRAYDEGFVRLDKPHEMALAAGFTTARGPQIWATRLDLLQQHQFIKLAPGAQGPRSFALILHPHLVMKSKRSEIEPRLYNTLLAQAAAIGADRLLIN